MASLSDAKLFAWIEHLEHCPSCRARLSGRSPGDTIYQEALERTSTHAIAAAPCIEDEKNAAPDHLVELLQLSAIDRAAAVAREPRFKTYSLASYILERSETAVSYNPQLALVLARLARSITVQIDSRTCGGAEALADLGAYSLAMEGNAQRVCGNMAIALAALARARQIQARGGVDPDLTGRINLIEASLRRDLRQTQEALSLVKRAAETFRILKDHERWLWSQINHGNIFIVQGEFDRACTHLGETLSQTNDPKVLFVIRHNLTSALALAGRASEASRLHDETQELYDRFSAPLITSRRRWLEALIARGLGEERRAGSLLEEVSAELDERGYAFDAALVRLDLGKVRARQGEPLRVC